MKFIHLSDLHIGKRVNEFSMLEDQRMILTQILSLTDKEKPDGVFLAGDIYDKPVPSAEAVQLVDEFLTRLARRGVLVFAISGNHDSPERLAFGARLFSSRGIYLSPVYKGNVEGISMKDSYGEVVVYLLPFLKPSMVRHVFGDEEVQSYQDAVRVALEHINLDTRKRNILVAHQFVTGATRCESEEIVVGGLDQIDVSLFHQFDYVALGHIHSPQHVGRETVRYCGTPLKYSFSEAGQEKSVTLIEMRGKGETKIRKLPLSPLRDMRRIRGNYMEVTARSFYQGFNKEDYIQITLTDEEDIPDGMQKLRVIYPHLMRLEYDNKRTRENGQVAGVCQVEKKSALELFGEFYELQNNQVMNERQKQFVSGMIRHIQEDGGV